MSSWETMCKSPSMLSLCFCRNRVRVTDSCESTILAPLPFRLCAAAGGTWCNRKQQPAPPAPSVAQALSVAAESGRRSEVRSQACVFLST